MGQGGGWSKVRDGPSEEWSRARDGTGRGMDQVEG